MMHRHCDYEPCDTYQRIVSRIPAGWWTLTNEDDEPDEERHFCDADHLMKWAAANSEPMEVVR